MKIFVKAKPGARNPGIKKLSQTNFVVAVRELPKDGRANQAIIRALAEYFDIPKSRINILVGSTSKNKIFEII